MMNLGTLHPDLVNNTLFLQYYQRWQSQQQSVAFVGVADLLFAYGCFQEAIRVCEEGLRHNPHLVSGRLILARALEATQCYDAAKRVVEEILERAPNNAEAKTLHTYLGRAPLPVVVPLPATPAVAPAPRSAIQPERAAPAAAVEQGFSNPWATLTMARLYAQQGLRAEALKTYEAIVQREPDNQMARQELQQLRVQAPATYGSEAPRAH
ncbi:MAG: tetratricopeptide repeat protein [Deltaproteobacteria bacterium]|nr:tetratricopeptide repeat protein [Deltaproteobacteria bacterium]